MGTSQTIDGFKESPVGHWVHCEWNFDSGDGEPHPDDVTQVARLCPNGVTTQCIGVEDDFFVLRYLGNSLRVRPFSIRILPVAPTYAFGERVRTVKGDSVKTMLQSTIWDIAWHVKQGQYVYFLDGDRRRRKRFYLEDQLERAE